MMPSSSFTVTRWQSFFGPKKPDDSMEVGFQFMLKGPKGVHSTTIEIVFPNGGVATVEANRMLPITASRCLVQFAAHIANAIPGAYAVRLTVEGVPLGEFHFTVS